MTDYLCLRCDRLLREEDCHRGSRRAVGTHAQGGGVEWFKTCGYCGAPDIEEWDATSRDDALTDAINALEDEPSIRRRLQHVRGYLEDL